MADLFDEICEMLTERGIEAPDEVLRGYLTMIGSDADGDSAYRGALGAIKRWDDRLAVGERVGAGLLRKLLLEGGSPGYKPAEQRSSSPGTLMLTGKRLASIRRVCLTPNGTTREIERSHYAELAVKAGVKIDDLLDEAVFSGWTETPPHPAYPWTGDWTGKPDDGVDRYGAVVCGESPVEAHPVERRSGESDWEFSRRFWRYQESPAILKAAAARKAELDERREAAAEARERWARVQKHQPLRADLQSERDRAAKALGYESGDADADRARRVSQARSDEPLDDLW